MNRKRSGVEAPVGRFGEARGGDSKLAGERGGADTVVVRCVFVVSADGGGGRVETKAADAGVRIEARQRKHSPVPK